MKIYSASAAAAELMPGMPVKQAARTLRRFLRTEDSGFQPVGSGGSYEFSTSDMPKLRAGFTKWNSRPSKNAVKTAPNGEMLITDAPGLDPRVARHDRAAVQKLTKERIDRLEAALKARGLHLSQMREREGWAPRRKANA